MKDATKAQKKQYMKNSSQCLFCLSTNIEGGSFETGDDEVWQTITCNDCGRAWNDVYTRKHVEVVE